MTKLTCNILILLLFFLTAPAIAAQWSVSDIAFLTSVGETYLNPQWHPNNQHLTINGQKYRGIFLYDHSSKQMVRKLSNGCGFGAQFIENGEYLLTRKAPGTKSMATPDFKLIRVGDGRQMEANSVYAPGRGFKVPKQGRLLKSEKDTSTVAFAKPDHSVVYINEAEKIVLKEGDMTLQFGTEAGYFDPKLSDDGRYILSHHKNGSIYLIDTQNLRRIQNNIANPNTFTDNIRSIAKGERASFLDNTHIIYQVSEDNGSVISASTLFIYDINIHSSQTLELPADLIPLSPTVSRDGRYLAFEDYRSGRIVTAKIEKGDSK